MLYYGRELVYPLSCGSSLELDTPNERIRDVRGINELDERTRASAGLLPSDRARALHNEQDRERGQQVIRNYELEKVETYAIRARNIDEAIEILNGLDNSSAYRVDVRVIYASAPTEGEGKK